MLNLNYLRWRTIKAYYRGFRHKKIPSTLIVEPTNYCNLQCSYCPQGIYKDTNKKSREKGFMNLNTFNTIINKTNLCIRNISLYLHGEPFLNSDLPEFARIAYQNKISIAIYTNGLIVNEDIFRETLKWFPKLITISADLLSETTYNRFKKEAYYDKAVDKVKRISEISLETKSKTKLILRSIYAGEDKDEVNNFLNYWFKIPRLSTIQFTNPFVWPGERNADFLANKITKAGYYMCPQVWGPISIAWDGTAYHCSYDYCGKYPIGNINDNSFKEILNSRESVYFRKMHILGKRQSIELCSDCLIPRCRNTMITVKKNKYLTSASITKDKVFESISKLYLSVD